MNKPGPHGQQGRGKKPGGPERDGSRPKGGRAEADTGGNPSASASANVQKGGMFGGMLGPKRVDVKVAAATAPLEPPSGFVEQAMAQGIEFEPGEVEKLGLYLAELMAVNETMNLTAVKDAGEAWTRHILDSLTLIATLAHLPEGAMVIDVGSGGGLPGVPLAICLPKVKFTLLEATKKKAEFLRQVVEHLGLKNVRVQESRAEHAAHDRGTKMATGRVGGHREMYDAAVARAVGRLNTLVELVVPFVKIGGNAILIKGQQAEEELKEAEHALKILNAVYVETVATPTGRVVILEKRVATPRDYPRKDGEPKRSPLGAKKEEKRE